MQRTGITQVFRMGFAAMVLFCVSGQMSLARQLAAYATPTEEETSTPIGWRDFCVANPDECRVPRARPATIILDEKNWRDIVKINAAVNQEIEPATDMEHWGVVERWSYPDDGKGDCEDYVLEKRRRLMRAGYPRQALLVTVVRDHKGDGHAVLTVKTDRGDFILDNQAPKVLGWAETGYRFIKRQSQEDPNRWVSLGGFDTATVAGTRK